MLNAKNIKTTCLNKLLNPKNLSLFRIIKAINNSVYKPELSDAMKRLYSVFHLRMLYLHNSNLLSRQIDSSLSFIEVDEETQTENYEATEILNARIDKRRKDSVTDIKRCLMCKTTTRTNGNQSRIAHFRVRRTGRPC